MTGVAMEPPVLTGAPPMPRVWPGVRAPLGATFDGEGTNFAIFSEHATGVESAGERESKPDLRHDSKFGFADRWNARTAERSNVCAELESDVRLKACQREVVPRTEQQWDDRLRKVARSVRERMIPS